MSTITAGATYPITATPDIPSSVPNPEYSGTFIPALWSGKLIEKFYDASVLAAISNTDYEGEITSYGDKVIIRYKPDITINTYDAYQTLTTEAPSRATDELNIDQGRYWSTTIDDVMEIQSDIDQLSMWADDASEQMKINIDTDVLKTIAGAIEDDSTGVVGAGSTAPNANNIAGRISANIALGKSANNTHGSGSPVALDRNNVIDLIVGMGQAMDEYNIPENGRWVILPAWVCALIKRSELRDASLTGDGVSMSRNGRLGMIDRFTIYMSNLLPTAATGDHGWDSTADAVYTLAAGEFRAYFGHSHGLTFASQLTKVETLRGESTFGTILRGLQVFGRKVVDNTSLGTAILTKA